MSNKTLSSLTVATSISAGALNVLFFEGATTGYAFDNPVIPATDKPPTRVLAIGRNINRHERSPDTAATRETSHIAPARCV